jgi:hypothetical protein
MSEPTMVERLARRWNERLTQDFEIPVVQPMPGWYANDARWWLRAIAEEVRDPEIADELRAEADE